MRWTVLALVALGCKGDDDGGDGTATGDDDDTVPGDDDDDDLPDGPTGFLYVGGAQFGPMVQVGVAAVFATEPPTTSTTGTFEEIPLETCVVEPSGSTTWPTTIGTGALAGEVTATFGEQQVPLQVDPTGTYANTLPAWPAGLAVGFAATGDEVPAFEVAELFVAPEAPAPVTITRQGDGAAEVTWGGATTGEAILIALYGPKATVTCRVEDDGAFVVAAADAQGAGESPQLGVSRYVVGASEPPGISLGAVAQIAVFAN